MDRRQFIITASTVIAGVSVDMLTGCTTKDHDTQIQFKNKREQLQKKLAALETASGGRLGVYYGDTGNRYASCNYRAQEKFPMCSTFKFLAAAAILARVDDGREQLDRRIQISKSDLVTYSPATEKQAGGSMTVAEICEAAITLSDNSAANLLLRNLGGPKGLTQFLQSVYQTDTRLDRMEPFLNEAAPGDERDTTTPVAMGAYMRIFAINDRLKPATRALLLEWMIHCKTGDARIRAGLPKTWRVGDKTGTGEHGTSNDIAIAYPPGGKPVIICIYLTGSPKSGDERNATLAAVTRTIVECMQPG